MIRLVDRLNGEVLGDIPLEDLKVLHDALIEEDDADADYYLNPDTLELLTGMSPEGLAVLRKALTDREELDIGWEPVVEEPAARVFGSVMSELDLPLGGLLLDLADVREEVEDALGWSFTRPDGSFEVLLGKDELEAGQGQELVLTVSTVGDDWLAESSVNLTGSTAVEVGQIRVPTFNGRVISDEEKRPLEGIAVQVSLLADGGDLEWFGTWVTTRADGSFCFPYRRPDESVPARQTMLLELLGPGGEPLTEVEIENPMEEIGPDLGELECPDPETLEMDEEDLEQAEAEEGAEPDEDVPAEEDETAPVDAVLPGIKQNPLD